MKSTEDNGISIVMNLDSLKDTKSDPKAGALILQEIRRTTSIVLHSDFCQPKDLLTHHNRIHVQGRPDPALAEKASTKKPSHS